MKNKLKNRLKKLNKYHVLLVVMMLFCAALLIYLTDLKVGMHLDEYLSYGHANHEADGLNKINPEYGVRMSATDIFDPFFYADGFSIKNVWLNQGNNIVHPPIYYLLLHIFTLVTNNFLALKTGVLLNIIIHMVNIALVWCILKEMLRKEYEALTGAVLYAFMPVILGNVLFVRMYMLLSAFILALTLVFIKRIMGGAKKPFYIALFIVSVFGTLTHYYFLIYLFFCCLIWGGAILIKRNWKELAVFIGTMAAAGIASVAIFPYIIKHLFGDSVGEKTRNNLISSAFSDNINKFVEAIDNVYGGFLLAVVIAAVALLIFAGFIWREKRKNPGKNMKYIIVLIPCLLYFFTVTWISQAAASRYVSPIYPICVILLICLFDALVSYMTANDKAKCVAVILLAAVLLNSAWKSYEWPELHLDAQEAIDNARKYGVNNECIYVLNVSWHSFPSYQEFIQYQNMTFIRDSNLDLLFNESYADYDHVVMYFDRFVSQEKVEEILDEMIEMNPGLETWEKLHTYSYNTAYYLE